MVSVCQNPLSSDGGSVGRIFCLYIANSDLNQDQIKKIAGMAYNKNAGMAYLLVNRYGFCPPESPA